MLQGSRQMRPWKMLLGSRREGGVIIREHTKSVQAFAQVYFNNVFCLSFLVGIWAFVDSGSFLRTKVLVLAPHILMFDIFYIKHLECLFSNPFSQNRQRDSLSYPEVGQSRSCKGVNSQISAKTHIGKCYSLNMKYLLLAPVLTTWSSTQ